MTPTKFLRRLAMLKLDRSPQFGGNWPDGGALRHPFDRRAGASSRRFKAP
jgi:hypothetical protein